MWHDFARISAQRLLMMKCHNLVSTRIKGKLSQKTDTLSHEICLLVITVLFQNLLE